ncbi:MAG TPA: F0F1 ATP synthase subunit delta [Symbiobacteriaceae bacterium]
MANQVVARRYAQALFELAQERNMLDQVERELGMVAELVRTNLRLRSVLEDVMTSAEVKQHLMEALFRDKVSDLVLHFLFLVVRKRREALIPQMFDAYVEFANEARGIVEVEVRSAVPMDEDVLQRLQQRLEARLGKRVKFQTQVAPELIGGLVVRVGDLLMDGSVRTRLNRMRERLIRAKAE